MNNSRIVLLMLLPALFLGCVNYITPPPAAGYYYINPDKDLTDIGRVAIVELANVSSYPQINADVTKAVFQALQKRQVFGLTIVKQDDPLWRSLQLEMDSLYTLEELLAIQKKLTCDAVLVGTVTEYQPYPHMVIGLRLKLLDLRDGQLLWALEQIWDSADKTTEYRIKNYSRRQRRSDLTPLHEKLVAVSPLGFVKFVAYEVAATM